MPDGTRLPNEGHFLVFDRPREIVTREEDMRMRVTFHEAHGKTRMVIEQTGLPMSVMLDQAREGWGAILAKLGATAARAMATMEGREIVSTRLLDAPREAVFDAFTRREQVDLWFGPDGFRNETSAMDVRPGGEWRYTMHAPDGTRHANLVRYIEVARPERLAFMHGSPDEPDQFRTEILLDEEAGRTRITMRSTFPSHEAMERVKGFGAVELGLQSLARLAQLLATR